MSQPALAVEPTPRSVAILGADALLGALPSTPTQLANACFAGGFAEVFPATWGDELIASGCLEQLEGRTGPAIFCACPLVAEQLRGAAELRRFIVPLISPPVAVARYLRGLYADESIRITYVGDCPGADDASIDERMSPHELLDHLAKRGILPATQRPDLGEHAARDRRRFYSLPGGVPAPQWLSAQWPKRTLVDVHAGDALASLANQTLSRGNTLIDFAPHLGCACAGAVGGTSAQEARKAVVALEPPRAQSEIVTGEVRVEVSLAQTGDRHLAEVSWNEFLAALPAALAMPAEGALAPAPASRTEPRRMRAREKKVVLPRAYLATRQGARRERTAPVRARAALSPSSDTRAELVPSGAGATSIDARRDDTAAQRPSAWVARRASHEGMTGPRNQSQRAGLAPADRWLLTGLMLAASVLVAVLTSALTVRGMQRTDASPLAVRHDTTIAVAATAPAPAPPAAAPEPRKDSVLVAAAHADSAPQHEDAGTVGTPPATVPHRTSAPAHAPRTAEHHDASRVGKRALSVAERSRVIPPAIAGPAPQITHSAASAPSTQSVSQPVPQPRTQPVQPPPAVSTPAASAASTNAAPPPAAASAASTNAAPPPAAASAAPATQPAASANTNAQFLEELRAIHAEIDARKRHMDSLTRSLDSLKKVSPPR